MASSMRFMSGDSGSDLAKKFYSILFYSVLFMIMIEFQTFVNLF